MQRFNVIGVVLVAVFALGAVMASVSQAETAPYFTLGGTRLVAGRTHNFDARQFGGANFVLAFGGLKITCEGLGTEEGVLLGSNAESPGKDNEIVVFSKCKLIEGNGEAEGCELESPTIRTEPLKSEQVENVEGTRAGKQLYREFFPAFPANGFFTLKFKPAAPPCTLLEAILSGSVAGETLLDNASQGSIELGQAPQERTSWLLKFPATSITEVWLISNGVGKIQKQKLTSFGATAVLTGTALVLLASTKHEPEPNALWSPLP